MRWGYVKPGLDIRDEKVRLEVIDYIRPDSLGGRARMLSSLIVEPIEKNLMREIKENTLYEIQTSSTIDAYARNFVNEMSLDILTLQAEYKEIIRAVGREHNLDYIITTYIYDVEVTVGDQVYASGVTRKLIWHNIFHKYWGENISKWEAR